MAEDKIEEILQGLLDRLPGGNKEVCRLGGGLSEAVLVLLETPTGQQVLKIQPEAAENDFFTRVAPKHFPDVTWLPVVYESGLEHGYHWLLMEHIPNGLPTDRYNFDQTALAVLRELHQVCDVAPDKCWEDHTWSSDQLSVAERYLPATTMAQMYQIYEQYLVRRKTSMSLCIGDPNAPNWLVRDNGEIVLIDWQMVSRDHIALDLAGWVSNVAPFAALEEIAAIYLGNTSQSSHVLAEDFFIFCCRRWTTNFWRSEISTKPEMWARANEYMGKTLPGWMDENVKTSGLL